MNDTTSRSDNGKRKENPYAHLEESLGAIVNLMAAHPHYAGKTLKDIHERVLPPLAARQFRLVRNEDGEAVAYLSWAMVSDGVEKLIGKKNRPPRPSDWQSGETGLLIDVVCADSRMAQQMIRRLKAEVFADKTLKALTAKSGNGNGEGKAELTQVR